MKVRTFLRDTEGQNVPSDSTDASISLAKGWAQRHKTETPPTQPSLEKHPSQDDIRSYNFHIHINSWKNDIFPRLKPKCSCLCCTLVPFCHFYLLPFNSAAYYCKNLSNLHTNIYSHPSGCIPFTFLIIYFKFSMIDHY